FLARIAEHEEPAAAPYPEQPLAGDLFLLAELGQFVKYRPREARLEPGPHQDIGCRRAVGSGFDAQRMVRGGGHNLVEIGAEDQPLAAALALHIDRDREERHVLDRDAAAFGRGDQPIAAVILAAQY